MLNHLLWGSKAQKQTPGQERSSEVGEDDFKMLYNEYKILLFGTGQSGKSTIATQLHFIYGGGFTEEERETYRQTIHRNVFDSARAILSAIEKLGLTYPNQSLVDRITNYQADSTGLILSSEITAALAQFWQDPFVMTALEKRRAEFCLMDNAQYFLSEVTRIGSPDYIPTNADIIRAHKHSGSVETRFTMGGLPILMVEIGDQRPQLKEWFHYFEDVKNLIFCAALSDYDCAEDGQNRMAESLTLFESIATSKWFASSTIILFLNKVDILREKLSNIPLEEYFPEYEGKNDLNKAVKFILWKYMQCNNGRLSIYPHLTQATDSTQIRPVFSAIIQGVILNNALKDSWVLV